MGSFLYTPALNQTRSEDCPPLQTELLLDKWASGGNSAQSFPRNGSPFLHIFLCFPLLFFPFAAAAASKTEKQNKNQTHPSARLWPTCVHVFFPVLSLPEFTLPFGKTILAIPYPALSPSSPRDSTAYSSGQKLRESLSGWQQLKSEIRAGV